MHWPLVTSVCELALIRLSPIVVIPVMVMFVLILVDDEQIMCRYYVCLLGCLFVRVFVGSCVCLFVCLFSRE